MKVKRDTCLSYRCKSLMQDENSTLTQIQREDIYNN